MDYISELTHLVEDVREAGVSLDDGELSLIALNGLNSAYDGFVTTYTTRTDDIPFSAFQGLQEHEARSSRPATTQQFQMENMVQGNLEANMAKIHH